MEEEVREVAMANPGELQVGVEATNHIAVDLKRMTKTTSLYRLRDTWHQLIKPSKT